MPTESVPPDDVQLIRRVRAQDQQALGDLYDRYGALVYGLASRILDNDNRLAEEVTQDTFLKVWTQAAQWDANRGKLATWLLSITRNAAIDALRRERRRPPLALEPIDDLAEALGKPGLADDPQWQNGRLLRRLLQDLPPEQTQVIELAFYYGMSHSQIADHLLLPLGTVKARIRLGLQKLKALWLEASRE